MHPQIAARIIAFSLFAAVFAGNWDVWWHASVGRDTFWEPPHLLLYGAIIVAISLAGLHFYRSRARHWLWLSVSLLLAPLAAPFDEFWHRIFGVEPINSPIIIWSPPHLLLVSSIGLFAVLILRLLKAEQDPYVRRLFGALCFGSLMSSLLFTTVPIQPAGPFALIGFYGAGVIACFLVFVCELSARWMKGIGGATLSIGSFILLTMASTGERIAPGVVITPHEHSPNWLIILSFLLAAIVVDLGARLPPLVRTMTAGGFFGFFLYTFSSPFFAPAFQYSLSQAGIAVVSSLVGGILAGLLLMTFNRTWSPATAS